MHGRLTLLLVLLWLSAGTLSSQNSSSSATKTPLLTPDSGKFEKGVYTNEFFRFSYRPGEDWFLNEGILQAPVPRGAYNLLAADRRTEAPIKERILLMVDDTSKYHPPISLESFATKMAHALAKKRHTELVRDAYRVEYAGQHFYRADYQENWIGGALHKTFAAFEYKGFFLCWTFVSESRERKDEMVNSLGTLAFTH